MIFSVTGPESSGKTTLCQSIHLSTNWLWIPEYSRSFLQTTRSGPTSEMILRIASAQSQIERLLCFQEHITLCDTDAYTLAVWWMDKIGTPLPTVLTSWLETARFRYQHVFLCQPDIPWEQDPLREDANRRFEIMAIYQRLLNDRKIRYTTLNGQKEARLNKAIATINAINAADSSRSLPS